MKLEVLRGAEAHRALENRGFQARWRSLHQQCPWATVFQNVGFATTWYGVYRDVYEPIVAAGIEPSGAISGLFLLARDRTSGAVAHVGEKHAEYQTWIALPDRTTFIGDALDAIKPLVGGATLQLRYAPSRLPLETLTSSQSWGWRTVSWLEERGIADLTTPDGIATLVESSRYRYRLRRIGALGEVSFRTVTTRAELEPWLDEIIAFCDVRQGAINGAFPFHDDALKRELHLGMLDTPDLLHVTLLTAGKTLISSQINFRDGQTISLGLISHSPMQGKISPGTLHLLLLARHAAAEGFEAIDLTPGGEYKDRFASYTDPTRVVSIQFSATQAVRAQVRRFAAEQAKTGIREMGLEPVAVKKQFVERVEHLRRSIRGRGANGMRGGGEAVMCVYRVQTRLQSPAKNDVMRSSMNELRVDEVGDLLLPSSSGVPLHDRRTELRTALARFERGAQLITRIEHGRLINQAWMTKGPAKAHLDPDFAEYEVADKSVLVHGVTGDGKSLADHQFFDDVISLVQTRNPKLELLVAATEEDVTSLHLAERGAELVTRLSSRGAGATTSDVAASGDSGTEQKPASE